MWDIVLTFITLLPPEQNLIVPNTSHVSSHLETQIPPRQLYCPQSSAQVNLPALIGSHLTKYWLTGSPHVGVVLGVPVIGAEMRIKWLCWTRIDVNYPSPPLPPLPPLARLSLRALNHPKPGAAVITSLLSLVLSEKPWVAIIYLSALIVATAVPTLDNRPGWDQSGVVLAWTTEINF